MFTISVERSFNASHMLTLPDGSKETPHSHDWRLTVAVSSHKLNRIGLVMDFVALRTLIDNAVGPFENTALHCHSYFSSINPSAENLARYLYDRIAQLLPRGIMLEYVSVAETPGCVAKYSDSG